MYSKETQSGRKPSSPAARLKPVTARMQKLNAEYHRVLDEIDQELEPICQGCQAPEFSHSHSIPRNYKAHAYLSDKRNIWRLCAKCHTGLYETGYIWMLDCGEEIMANILACDEDYYKQKVMQVAKRLDSYKKKNWLQISQGLIIIPDWVESIVGDISF